MIPIYKPYLPKKSKKYALEALEDGWLTNSKYNIEVEEILCDLLGAKHVLLVCNGTAATHLVSKALQYKHPEVNTIIVPNIVYVAAWNSFLFDNRYNIKMTKTCPETWNIDLQHIKQLITKNSALLLVHNLGNPINVPEDICPIVEDSCEALFGKFSNGSACGTRGLAASISFFGNKTITSGEGGAIIIKDDDVAQYIEKIRGQGQSNKRYIHDTLGYNYRMTNVQAAILRGQIDCIYEILDRKYNIWNIYNNAFKDRDDIILQKTEQDSKHSNWMYGIRFPHNEKTYEEKQDFFNKNGVEIRPMFYPMNFHKHLINNDRVDICTDIVGNRISETTIMLPSYPELTKEDQYKVIDTVNKFLKG